MNAPQEPSAHIADRTFVTVINAYLASPKFASLSAGTQVNYRCSLRFAGSREGIGDVPVSVLRPAIVQGFLDGLANEPGRQVNMRVALKAVEKWAIVRDLLPHVISLGTETVGGGDGHRPWTDHQIETAIKYARPEISRAILLAANTGQRGSDLIKMAWSDLEEIDGRIGIHVIQKKTGLELWIPFTAALATVVATWERRPAPLLLRDDGTPWAKRGWLTMAWVRERSNNPELAPCKGLTLHGLRASACVRLRRLGATEAQISAMVGLSIPMVTRYCRKSVQKENAMAAVIRLDGTSRERNNRKKQMGTE